MILFQKYFFGGPFSTFRKLWSKIRQLWIKTFEKNIFKVLEFHFPPILTLDNTILDNTILSKNYKIAASYLAPSLIIYIYVWYQKSIAYFLATGLLNVDCRLSTVGCRLSDVECRFLIVGCRCR